MKKCISLLVGILFLGVALLQCDDTSALTVDSMCRDVETVFARGSGQDFAGDEYDRFSGQLSLRIARDNVTIHQYELGTEVYNNAKYPAVSVDNALNGNAVGAYISGGAAFDYGKSVAAGKKELKAYIEQRMQKCPNAAFVLGGYSQGAQVAREGLAQLTDTQKDRVVFLALFGDPKLYLPEGEGIFPPACWGKDFSKWRRVIGSCHTDNGSLGAQKPYLSSGLNNKTGLWCNSHDFICGTTKILFDNAGHAEYAKKGRAIDLAAKEAASRIKAKLSAAKASKVDSGPKQGDAISGHDMVFVIDLEYSMNTRLPKIKDYIRKAVAKLQQQGDGRFAIVIYGRNTPIIVIGSNADPQSFVYHTNFEDDPQQVLDSLNNLEAWGNMAGSPLHGIKTSLDALNWRQGAVKSVILFTNKTTYASPDYEGITSDAVLKRALEIDPVSIFPVVPEAGNAAYRELADKSSGAVFTDPGEDEIKDEVFNTVVERPVVLFRNTEYFAPLGQEVTFDVSDSYALNSTITKYEWDLDGDLQFDATTSSPVMNHVYPSNGDRIVQVRATAANGMIANGSAVVKIGPIVAPLLPKAPLNLKATATSNTSTTATLTWTPADQLVDSWVISVNGTIIGMIAGDRTTIDINDLERVEDVSFEVVGMTAEKVVGDTASIVLGKLATTQPEPCNTGNFYNDLLCRIRLYCGMLNWFYHNL